MKVTPEQVLQSFAKRLVSAYSLSCTNLVAPAASTLPCFFSASIPGAREATCSLPSLALAPPKQFVLKEPKENSSDPLSLIRNLGRPIRFNKQDIETAPAILLRNLCFSFQSMLDDRLRRTAMALIEHSVAQSRKGGVGRSDAELHARLIKLLFPSSDSTHQSAVSITAAATDFHTLPPRLGTASKGNHPTEKLHSHTRKKILPVIIEMVLDISILGGKKDKATTVLRAPGTISGTFARGTHRIETVEVVIDTKVLLDCMTANCSDVVHQAAIAAASIAENGCVGLCDSNPTVPSSIKKDECDMPPPPRRPPAKRRKLCNPKAPTSSPSEISQKKSFHMTPAA